MKIVTKIQRGRDIIDFCNLSYDDFRKCNELKYFTIETMEDLAIKRELCSIMFYVYDMETKKERTCLGVDILCKSDDVFGIHRLNNRVIIFTCSKFDWSLFDYIDSPVIEDCKSIENDSSVVVFDNCKSLDRDGIYWCFDNKYYNIAKFYDMALSKHVLDSNTRIYLRDGFTSYKLDLNKSAISFISKTKLLRKD